MAENNRYCLDLVKKSDHDRYMTILYAPPDRRDDLSALYAFNYEISRIRESISEVMLGEIRLQWWREAIDDIFQGTTRKHDIIPALAKAIGQHDLSREIFMEILDGRTQDIYDESPKDIPALTDYLDRTTGNLSRLAVHVMGQRDTDDLAGRLGIAWGFVGMVRSVCYYNSLKKNFMPQELLTGYGHADLCFLSPDRPDAAKAVIRDLCQQAEQHLDHIRNDKNRIKPESRSVFLLSALTRSYLKTIKKAGYNPFKLSEQADAFFHHWRLLTAALFNRI